MSSSLSSAMFAGYNKFDDAKVRIGSWREELALKELTGVTRLANPRNKAVFNATDVRVLYHADKPGEKDRGAGKSVSRTSFVHPETVSTTKDRSEYNKPGPRAVLSKQRTRAILASENAERDALEAEKKNEGDFDTTFRQSYKRYSNEASRSAKQQSLKPRPNKSVQTAPKALTVNAGDGVESTTPEFEVGHYSEGKTITLWNTGGMAPGGKHGKDAFGRTSRFTEPGAHPSFFQEVWPDPGPHHRTLPRGLSDLEAATLMFLKKRVLERAQEQPLPSVRGLWRLLWPRTYRDAVGKVGQREFREAMAKFEVPVTQCEVWAVTTGFDNDSSGQICLDKLIHFIRAGGLAKARRDTVHELFRRLDSTNTGEVSLDRILAACDFSRSPAVTEGKAGEEQVVASFRQHFNTKGERAGDEAVAVSAEQFQDAFRDIGAACVQPEETCTWEAVGPRQHSECKEAVGVDVGQGNDKNEGDLMFMVVLSSLDRVIEH